MYTSVLKSNTQSDVSKNEGKSPKNGASALGREVSLARPKKRHLWTVQESLLEGVAVFFHS